MPGWKVNVEYKIKSWKSIKKFDSKLIAVAVCKWRIKILVVMHRLPLEIDNSFICMKMLTEVSTKINIWSILYENKFASQAQHQNNLMKYVGHRKSQMKDSNLWERICLITSDLDSIFTAILFSSFVYHWRHKGGFPYF